jgi:hypothetical protein
MSAAALHSRHAEQKHVNFRFVVKREMTDTALPISSALFLGSFVYFLSYFFFFNN